MNKKPIFSLQEHEKFLYRGLKMIITNQKQIFAENREDSCIYIYANQYFPFTQTNLSNKGLFLPAHLLVETIE